MDENSHLLWVQGSSFTLTSTDAGITSITYENEDLSGTVVPVASGTEEAIESGIRISYDWGTFQLEWEIDGGIAYGSFQIHNTSEQAIGDFSIDLLKLTLSDSVSSEGFEAFDVAYMDTSAFHSWIIDEIRLSAGFISEDPPLRLLGSSIESGEEGFSSWRVSLNGGVHRMDDGGITLPILGSARVPSGATLTGKFMIKETPASIPAATANAIFWSKFFRETWQAHNWPDRRPIGMLFLSAKHSASNPKGLFWQEDLDASDPDAVLAAAMSYVNRSLVTLQETGAQGIIAWDIEGTDLPISFVGDPRMLPILNPAMDAVADTFFSMYRDAGFKVGVTLRPTQVYFDENSDSWKHGTGSHGPERNPLDDDFSEVWPEELPWWRFFPIVERMDRKIQYAKDRWGCLLFYIDTNGIFREINTPHAFRWTLLNAAIFRELRTRHPDILIIPELREGDGFFHLAYYGTTAVYGELDLGGWGVPSWIRNIYPETFSAINISDGDIEGQRESLVNSVRSGDILLFRGWFADYRNEIVREIYEAAASDSP